MLKGIGTLCGVGIGKVFKYERPQIDVKEEKGETCKELVIFDNALKKTISDINNIKAKVSKSLNKEELAIYDALLTMANDPDYANQIKQMINEGYTALYSCKVISTKMFSMLEALKDTYLKERANDIEDVTYRILCNIKGIELQDLSLVNEKVIIVANELTPLDTAQLDKEYVLGFCTEVGTGTSHSAIMAISLGIPAIVGTKGILKNTEHNDEIIIDSSTGDVIVNPSDLEKENYLKKKLAYEKENEELKNLVNKESKTIDNYKVLVGANIGSPNDLSSVLENGADSIGLFRTEFLYMNSLNNFPSEEEQFIAYKDVLEKMNGKKVVIRTLDIGGDKVVAYYNNSQEVNPFLGYRAIRFCLDNKEIFKVQIRALLRASCYGKLAIMFPMISTIDEFKEAKEFVLKEKEELLKDGYKVSDDIEIGMMVEVPAAAILADKFAEYADFFSIGTNDLIQYSLAADRGNEKVSYLYQPLNPSIIRLIKMIIDGAHSKGKWCGMCGEMAGDLLATPVLIGLGIDELSMSSSRILKVRKTINNISYTYCKELANKLTSQATTEKEVEEIINKSIK